VFCLPDFHNLQGTTYEIIQHQPANIPMLSLKSNGALNTFGRMEVNTSKTETGANKQILHIPEKRRSEAWVSNYGHVL
jgi:hypothetical protein